MESSAEDYPATSSAAQNLLKRLENRRDLTPEPLDPESNASTPVESPEAPLDNRPQVELSAKQRRCSHPPAMVKSFDDGLAYCRLCYACLAP